MRSFLTWITLSTVTLSSAFLACGDDDPATTTAQGPSGPQGSGGSTGNGGQGGTAGSGGSVDGCDVDDGQCIFRHDTFGDEQFWTDILRLNELVNTLPPTTALGVGLKVDATAVPPDVLASADLEDPATTVALLQLDAVVGVKATVENGEVTRIGITCALCHSTVDDSVLPGVGGRLDGWPNRDLDPGLIISLTPGLADYVTGLGLDPEEVTATYASWGPGYYDARFNQDLISSPVLIPPAYGLADVALETYTGDGPISYWNAYVAVTQMGAQGNFSDPDLGIDIMHTPDLVTPKLPALADYQHSLEAPAPPADSFDPVAAAAGEIVFDANCASCHSGGSFTDAPTLHDPGDVGTDETEAMRSKTGMYRTTPLKGLWHRAPYFHDGSAATLADVVLHYNDVLALDLTEQEQADLVQYLLSL
jgi:cytochrome c5